MKKTIQTIIVAAISALILVLSACQSTPEATIVVPKDTERLIDQAEEGTADGTTALSIPSENYTLSTTGANGDLTIAVDASVDVPISEQLPMIRVTSKGFDQSTVTQIFNTVFSGQTVYDNSNNAGRTKTDIEKNILEMQQQLSDGSYEEYGFSEDEWEELISELEKEYMLAPDSIDSAESISDGTMKLNSSESYQFYELNVVSDTGSLRVQSNLTNMAADESYLAYYRKNAPTYTMDDAQKVLINQSSEMETDKIVNFPLSDAIDLCDGLLGNDNASFELASVFMVDDHSTGLSDDEVSSANNYAYKLFYVRKVDDIPVAVDAAMGMSEDSYNVQWSYEQIEVVIDKKGIVSLNWDAPISVEEVVKDNVSIISFDDANEIFEKMVFTVYESQTQPLNPRVESIKIDVAIDEIQLRLLRIREQNTEGTRTGILVPAWVYYGSVKKATYWDDSSLNTIIYQGSSNEFGNTYYWGPTIVLAINAIDGSIIDTAIGY